MTLWLSYFSGIRRYTSQAPTTWLCFLLSLTSSSSSCVSGYSYISVLAPFLIFLFTYLHNGPNILYTEILILTELVTSIEATCFMCGLSFTNGLQFTTFLPCSCVLAVHELSSTSTSTCKKLPESLVFRSVLQSWTLSLFPVSSNCTPSGFQSHLHVLSLESPPTS